VTGPQAPEHVGPTAPGAGLLALVGPTATGKTALGIAVASRIGGEVISMDSRQAYEGMRIGTAAPSPEELGAVPHHGVGFLSPGSRYSAGRFARLARRWIDDIRARGRVPLFVGGTGFFLRALLAPVFREPPFDPARRRRLREWLAEQPRGRVRRWALTLDPALAARLPDLDWQRAARTIELAWLSGRPLSWWQDRGEPEAPPVHARVFALALPADVHRERIGRRLDACWDSWIDEVRTLVEEGADPRAPGWSAVGYRQIAAWIRDLQSSRRTGPEAGSDDARLRSAIERATWQYARRQRTWFRHQLPDSAVWLDARLPTGQLARRISEEWSRAGAESRT
jgi:tRNA dimethylallyltransferase